MAAPAIPPAPLQAKSSKKLKPKAKTPPQPPPSHPPYHQMCVEAIVALKERDGSSQPAIAKFIEAKYGNALGPTFKKLLSAQLKNLVKHNKLVKVKTNYKLSEGSKPVELAAAEVSKVVTVPKAKIASKTPKPAKPVKSSKAKPPKASSKVPVTPKKIAAPAKAPAPKKATAAALIGSPKPVKIVPAPKSTAKTPKAKPAKTPKAKPAKPASAAKLSVKSSKVKAPKPAPKKMKA